MAANAVLKIKKAEEKGDEFVRNATERTKEILRNAEADGAAKRKAIIDEAMRLKAEIIVAAENKANTSTNGLATSGEKERKAILNPDSDRFNAAVRLVTERIVKLSGDS